MLKQFFVKMKNLFCVFIVLLSGCASQTVLLQVNTQPVGAYVTEQGTGLALGPSPTIAQYQRASLRQKNASGCAVVRGFKAQWVSGAVSSTAENISLCGNLDSYVITIPRDPNAADLAKDMEFALRLSTANAAQRQAEAAEAAAAIGFMGVMQQSAPVNCTTTAIGKSIQTNCR